ncbi:MAG: hypothetical protein ACXW2E_01905 [Nitrososphaeraceae archaeon]
MINEQTQPKYQVTINGIPYGTPQPSKTLAEALLVNLTTDQRQLAEITLVTAEGKQILFG